MRRSIFNAYVILFVAFILLWVVIIITRISYEILAAYFAWLTFHAIPNGTFYVLQHPLVLLVFILVALFLYSVPWESIGGGSGAAGRGRIGRSTRDPNYRRGRHVNSAEGALRDAYHRLVQQQRRRRRQAEMRTGTSRRRRRR